MNNPQQDLPRARLAELEAVNARGAIGSAIADALRTSGVPLRDGAEQQLVEVLRPSVVLHAPGFGQVVRGPNMMPVGAFVKQTLARPEFAHFVKPADPPPPAAAREILPGENLSEAVLRLAAAQRAASEAAAGDPRSDMSLPLGIKPRIRPPI